MHCPSCRQAKTRVCDSRSLFEAGTIRRKRECLSCGAGFFTIERAESVLDSQLLWVLKRAGGEERFSVEKLRASLRACVPSDDDEIIASLSSKICDGLRGVSVSGKGRSRVSSHDIGLSARRFLREHDFAAYVRYASVSASFRTIEDFTDFLATEGASRSGEQR